MSRIGTDPEVFLKGEDFISAERYFKGTKDKPEVIEPGFTLMSDNVAAEWTIPPANTADEFVASNVKMMDYIRMHLDYPVDICIQSSAEFPPEELQTKNSMTFGCAPDETIFGMPCIPNAKKTSLRSCGGHIHFETKRFDVIRFVVGFEMLVHLPITMKDPDRERRKLYGKCGSFRIKPYGFEFRSVSNYWLTSEDLMVFVFNQMQKLEDFKMPTIEEVNLLQSAINEYDENAWDQLVNQRKLELV